MRWGTIVGLLLLLLPQAAWAGRLIIDEENDTFGSGDDRHYTQGLRASWGTGTLDADSVMNQPFGWADDLGPLFPGDGQRQAEWIFGQSLFTPANLAAVNPDPRDRPYAGWVYGGLSLLQNNDGRQLENLELLAGMVGSAALGRQTQNDFHDIIKVGQANGWHDQLRNEPGVVLSYERKWRLNQPLLGNLGIELLPEAGVSLGNVFTYAETGAVVRFGQNLQADWGPVRVRPSLSGTSWFDDDAGLGWNVFASAQGRAMGRNIFLDGNTVQDSRSVDKRILVGDLTVGGEVYWSSLARIDMSVTTRSKEFYGQVSKDRYGMIGLTLMF
jgi:hypothetical protein